MRRILPAENSIIDPVTGKDVFKEPSPPDENSILTPSWLNNVQEEIANVVEGSGQTLDGSKYDQLREAIKKNHAFLTNTTINATAATLQATLDGLQGRYIAPGVEVVIQLPASAQIVPTRLKIIQPRGDQITIRGDNTSASSRTILDLTTQLPDSGDGFISVGRDSAIKLENIHLFATMGSGTTFFRGVRAHTGGQVWLKNCTITGVRGIGVLAESGGQAFLEGTTITNTNSSGLTGSNISANGIAAIARTKGYIFATGMSTSGSVNYSFVAESGGSLLLRASTFNDESVNASRGGFLECDAVTNQGNGKRAFGATDGGVMYATNCVAGDPSINSPTVGFFAGRGGLISATSCIAYRGQLAGFFAFHAGVIHCTTCSAISNASGFNAQENSYIHANVPTLSGNTTDYIPNVNTTDATLSRIRG